MLTERELQVIELMSKGYSNEYIMKTLYISKSTLRSHIHNIYVKFKLLQPNIVVDSSMRVRAVLYYLKEFKNGQL